MKNSAKNSRLLLENSILNSNHYSDQNHATHYTALHIRATTTIYSHRRPTPNRMPTAITIVK
jgi:hypothetical protein